MDKFCSQTCSNRFNGRLHRRPNRLCAFCNVEFYSKTKSTIFCSHKCFTEKRKLDGGYSKPRAKWSTEQKEAHSKRIKAYFDNGGVSCNKGKKLPERSGPNHHFWGKKRPELSGAKNNNWKGGITPIKKAIRHMLEYKHWRKSVFERDNFTCQECRAKGVHLNADHYPKSFGRIVLENNIRTLTQAIGCEELWNLNNGRTLCLQCHKQTDNYLWKGLKSC